MKVWLGIYEHKHGVDTSVYATEELAEQARIDTALERWEQEIDYPMPEAEPPNVIANLYFDAVAEHETFYVKEADVIGHLAPTTPAKAA